MEIKRKTECRKSCVVKQNLRLDDKNYKHFFFMLRIQLLQNINILLENVKKLALNTINTQGLTLSI